MTPAGIEPATFRFVSQHLDNITSPKLVRNRVRFPQNIVNNKIPIYEVALNFTCSTYCPECDTVKFHSFTGQSVSCLKS